jgi:hypothetical protein
MKLVLTPQLLKFLSRRGYQYCLSRTTCDNAREDEELIMLTPLRRRPALQVINPEYDALFAIDGEPARLAEEPGETLVLVHVETTIILKYLATVLQIPKKKKHHV